MKKIILILLLSAICLYLMAAAPVVSNVVATPSPGRITITYDLVADGLCDVRLVVSGDNGLSYNIYPKSVTGDVGPSVSQLPVNKQIIWYPAGDNMSVGAYLVKIIARDNPNPSEPLNFVFIEGASFDVEFTAPAYRAGISNIYVEKYEVSQSDYLAVMGSWNADPYNYGWNNGIGANYPVYYVTWFDAIEYCNRRSLQEGYTPCYNYNGIKDPDLWPSGWNSDPANQVNITCDWLAINANGYRLLTEMEWMFVAKGGMLGPDSGYNTYSGTSDPPFDYSWFSGNSSGRTRPIGVKLANELGMFDMSGNVCEWCWDVYQHPYPSGVHHNPVGPSPVEGSSRIYRGGAFHSDASLVEVRQRGAKTIMDFAGFGYYDMGFRIGRIAP